LTRTCTPVVGLFVAVFLLVGCGRSEAPATGFITENPPAVRAASDAMPSDRDGRPRGYTLLDKPLPEFRGERLDGGPFDSNRIDTWTVIDVWGIWCSDCMADAPYAAALARAIAQDPELDFLSIHTPPSAARADEAYGRYGSVSAYFEEKGYRYPTIVDRDASLRAKLSIDWTPSYLLISPDGIVRGFRTDLSKAGGTPVKDFLADIDEVRSKQAFKPRDQGVRTASLETLPGTLPFTLEAVGKAFPDHPLRAGRGGSAEGSVPVFEVMGATTVEAATQPLLTLQPGWDRARVPRIVTRSPAIRGPNGATVGTTRLADLDAALRQACTQMPDEADKEPKLVCPLSAEPGVFGIFAAHGGPGTANQLVEIHYTDPSPPTQAR